MSCSGESTILNENWNNDTLEMNHNGKRKVRLSNEGKRAAHVKFDGKTIALGTFPDEDADRICSRAKLLTKTWRDMYPKPSVEWVKRSLEQSGIRVVNDRPGRQPGPGRQSRRERTPNPKGVSSIAHTFAEGVGISVMRQIQATSQLSCLSIPAPDSEKIVLGSYTNSITNTAEGESVSSTHDISSAKSPHSTAKTTLPENLQNENPRDLKSTSLLTLEDLGDQDIEGTYAMLQRHHSNLINELEETNALMDAYRKERDRRQSQNDIQKCSKPII